MNLNVLNRLDRGLKIMTNSLLLILVLATSAALMGYAQGVYAQANKDAKIITRLKAEIEQDGLQIQSATTSYTNLMELYHENCNQDE